MAVVGIDLGTTYSVVATPKHFEGEHFQNVRGVTIIKDEKKLRLTPSVVGVGRQGEIIVGHRAKNLAGRPGPEPIMWVKRSMGEARQFDLGQRHLQPENVSAEILRYLKEMAEAQMQEPIEEVVITVPAWFTLAQKQKTKEAGELAGLKVSEILQEPVAAALMYCYDDERDPLTIMTYDLGGGTFDIAVLKKAGGHFEILAFDGNRHLGGYDFDKRLATWIIEQLQKQGYQIDSDSHSSIWYKVLMIAEIVKQKLSENETYLLEETQTDIQDLRGDPIVIQQTVFTREVFEDLIRDYIEETIRLCKQAIKRAEINVQDLTEIVMVGGCSRIPMTARLLQAEFGLKPKLVEPDLCVAIGAAILAQRLPKRVGPLKVNPIPETTGLSSFQVSGKLEETEQLPDVSECQVELVQIDGTFRQQVKLNKQGGYIFQLVPLVPNRLLTFSLRALDGAGRQLAEHRFSVRQQTGEPPKKGGITWLQGNILAKPISIMTVTGLYTIAEAGKALSWECNVSARTTDQTGAVRIPVYEDTYQIGEIVVDDLPTDLEIGTKVEITLNIKEDFNILGKARVRNKEGQAKIQIPATVVRGLSELKVELQQVREQAEQALAQGDKGQAFRVRPEIKRNLDTCQRILYDEKDPNLSNVQELLDKTRTLIRGLFGWQPDPPVESFDEIRREIEDDLLPELYKYRTRASSDDALEGELKAIVLLSEKALKEKNDLGWADACDHIRRLRNRISADLENEARKRRGKEEETPPDPHAIKLKLAMDLVGMRKEAERRGLLNQLEKEFQACDQTLKAIEPGLKNGMARLVEYYQMLHEPLYTKVTGMVERKDPKRGWVEVFS